MKKLIIAVVVLAITFVTSVLFHLTQVSYKEFHTGRKLYAEQQFEEAAPHFMKAYQLDAEDETKIFYLIDTYERLGRIEEVRDALEQYVSLAPGNRERDLQLAGVYYKLGEYGSAEGIYRKYAEQPGASSEVRRNMADVLLSQKKYDEVLPLLSSLCKEVPDDLALTAKLADVNLWVKNYDEAIRLYAQLEKAGIKTAELYNSWGDALRFSGRDAEAMKVYEKGVSGQERDKDASQ